MTRNATADVRIGYNEGHYFAVCGGHHDDGTLCLWLGPDVEEYADAATDAAWHRLSHAVGIDRRNYGKKPTGPAPDGPQTDVPLPLH